MKETKLETIVSQKSQQIKYAIEEAIMDGAKVVDCVGTIIIDGVIIVKEKENFAVCLEFDSDILSEKIKPSREQVEEKLKAAEEEVTRLKEQLKQYDNETNND